MDKRDSHFHHVPFQVFTQQTIEGPSYCHDKPIRRNIVYRNFQFCLLLFWPLICWPCNQYWSCTFHVQPAKMNNVLALRITVTLTLDLLTSQINRGHLLVMSNLPTKSEDVRLNRPLHYDQTWLRPWRSRWPLILDLRISELIRIINLSCTTYVKVWGHWPRAFSRY